MWARAPDAGEDYAALAKTYVRSSLDSDHIADALTLRFRATCRHSRLRRLRGMLSHFAWAALSAERAFWLQVQATRRKTARSVAVMEDGGSEYFSRDGPSVP